MDSKTVYIDFEFTKIGEIDTMNGKYYVDLSYQISWTENQVIETYDKDVHWNPKIYIENIFAKPEETIEYELSRDDLVTYVVEKRRLKVKQFFLKSTKTYYF
jgi:hypothetical protein